MVKVGESYLSPRSLKFSVFQGSGAGPKLYLAHTRTIQEFVGPYGNPLHDFTDDHGSKLALKHLTEGLRYKNMKVWRFCLQNIKTWMYSTRLKMNKGKTEFMQPGSRQQLSTCEVESIDVN